MAGILKRLAVVTATVSLAVVALNAPAHAAEAPTTSQTATITEEGTVMNGSYNGSRFVYQGTVTITAGTVAGTCAAAFVPSAESALWLNPYAEVTCWVETSQERVDGGPIFSAGYASGGPLVGLANGTPSRFCMQAWITTWSFATSYADPRCVPFS
jgi:hypothetical protein